MRSVPFLLALTGCNSLAGLDALQFEQSSPPVEWLEGWARRKEVVIGPLSFGAVTLTDFPFAVIVASDAELAAGSTGDDIAFTDTSGVRLHHELEVFDQATGALVAWVRIPSLPTQGSTALWLYYDNAAAEPQPAHDTWRQDYEAVWHFGSTLVVLDSTSAGHDGAAGSAATPASAAGVLGQAAQFDGVDDLVSVGDPQDGSLDFGIDSFSLSLWVEVQVSVGELDKPLVKGAAAPPDPGYGLELGVNTWYVDIDDGVTELGAQFGAETSFLGAWTHLVVVIDRSSAQFRAYANAQLATAVDIGQFGSVDNATPLTFGDGAHAFAGKLDEVRIVRAALLPEWIALEHENLRAPDRLVTVGPEQRR